MLAGGGSCCQPLLRRWRRYAFLLLLFWLSLYLASMFTFRITGLHLPTTTIVDEKAEKVDRYAQHRFSIGSNFSDSVGHIWPRRRDPRDRILNQINLADRYGAAAEQRRRTKNILRVGNFNWYTWEPGRTWFKDCPVSDCSLSNDWWTASSADALLITEFYRGWRWYYLPKPAHQVWITQHWESALHDRINADAVHGLINWTVSYRRDSTIPISYSRFYPADSAGRAASPTTGSNSTAPKDYAAGKTKKVAWFVSNCRAWNQRQRYARELATFIEVDVYGECGTMSCPRADEQSCLQLLARDYKFYLAFENSNCDDYITEKVSNVALGHDVVPIVLGARREDYAAFAPTHSYIHVDDFADPEHLANYLHALDANDTLYNEFFRWKGSWLNIDQRYWCRLCALLHWRDDVDYVSWYEDYQQWWNGACDRSPQLPWFQRNSANAHGNSLAINLFFTILVSLIVVFVAVLLLAYIGYNNIKRILLSSVAMAYSKIVQCVNFCRFIFPRC